MPLTDIEGEIVVGGKVLVFRNVYTSWTAGASIYKTNLGGGNCALFNCADMNNRALDKFPCNEVQAFKGLLSGICLGL